MMICSTCSPFDAGPLKRRLHRRRAERGGLHSGERALERAHGRAGVGTDDNRVGRGGHDNVSRTDVHDRGLYIRFHVGGDRPSYREAF